MAHSDIAHAAASAPHGRHADDAHVPRLGQVERLAQALSDLWEEVHGWQITHTHVRER